MHWLSETDSIAVELRPYLLDGLIEGGRQNLMESAGDSLFEDVCTYRKPFNVTLLMGVNSSSLLHPGRGSMAEGLFP